MESFSFYKSLYERELKRRFDLDISINLPLTLLTLIAAYNSYLNQNLVLTFNISDINIHGVIVFLTFCGFSFSILFLILSYNNLFKGYGYRNFAHSTELRKYEMALKDYNSKVDEQKSISFENELINRLNSITDHNIFLNDKRGIYIYYARTSIIITIIFTVLQLFFNSNINT